MTPIVEVVAGVLADNDGRLLLQQRAENSDHGGHWEFPGGKKEAEESDFVALQREWIEELGTQVESAELFFDIWRIRPDLKLHLKFWRITQFSRHPQPLEGQPLQWLYPDQTQKLLMPVEDREALIMFQRRSESFR